MGPWLERAIVPQRRCRGGTSYNRPMALPPEVCIRGAGIVGRTLALLLARERVRVALVAPAVGAAPAQDVRAYALNAASKALLESLRAWPDAAHATPVREMLVHGDEGGRVQFMRRGRRSKRWPGSSTCRRWSSSLADAVRFQPRIEVVDRAGAGAAHGGLRGPHQRHARSAGRALRGHALSAARDRGAASKPRSRTTAPRANGSTTGGEVLALLPLGGRAASAGAGVVGRPAARAATCWR